MFSSILSGISELFTDAVPGWFSVPCFLKGVGEGLLIGIGTLLVIAALPAEIAVFVTVGLIALGVYGAVRLFQAWPQMTGDQKSEAVGQITGGIIAGGAGPKFIPPPGMTVPAFAMVQTATGEMVLVPVTQVVAPATAGTLTGAAASGMAMATTGGGGGGDGGDGKDEKPKPSRTTPTGQKGDKPTGRRTPVRLGENERSDIRENESADILASNGYKVEQNPKVPPPYKPDYQIEGKIFDNIAPDKGTPADNIIGRALEKVNRKQADRIVLNLTDSDASLDQLQGALDARRATPDSGFDNLMEIIVIKDDAVVPFYP